MVEQLLKLLMIEKHLEVAREVEYQGHDGQVVVCVMGYQQDIEYLTIWLPGYLGYYLPFSFPFRSI